MDLTLLCLQSRCVRTKNLVLSPVEPIAVLAEKFKVMEAREFAGGRCV